MPEVGQKRRKYNGQLTYCELDGAAILESISAITNSTIALNDTVGAWHGDLLGSLPIIVYSTELLANINNGVVTAKASANLTLDETVSVAGATLALASDVNSTLSTIIAAKAKFDELLLGAVIWGNLELEKAATDKFSAAVIEKVPEAFQAAALTITAPIE